ncbi:MAG: peptidylprolyl isomerase [Bernardetiaceae bacterium]|nr:peptidylprolyl isomerase [Bernardetiaceae bacterium]
MKLFVPFIFVLALIFSLPSCRMGSSVISPSQTLFSVGKGQVSTAEFAYIYDKNNQSDSAWQEAQLREYLDLYTRFKMKVAEARHRHLDTTASFQKEFAAYKEQLAKPYLTTKTVSRELVEEAYQRLSETIRASHILLRLDPYAAPEDTARIYKKMQDLRKRILNGEDFGKIASAYSEDGSVKKNQGDLGYFTAMQMVYPFENAAYQTAKGKVSDIFRTRFGYHILEVSDRRPSIGTVQVAHILVRATEGIPKEDSVAARNKIFEIHKKLGYGEDWADLCARYSEDITTRNNGGTLRGKRSPGTMLAEFEDAVYDLKVGTYSKPFQTPYGWHILKLEEQQELEPLEEIYEELEAKVARDSRADVQRKAFIQKLKKENQFAMSNKAQTLIMTQIDSTVWTSNWKIQNPNDDALKQNIFTIKKQKYKLRDFYNYLEKHQQLVEPSTLTMYANQKLEDFIEKSMLDYEKANLAEKYPDYRYLLNEYYEGMLLFKIMEQEVWTRALNDTEGLQAFYEANKEKYKQEEAAEALIFDAASVEIRDALRKEIEGDVFYINTELDEQETQIKFDKDQDELNKAQLGKIALMMNALTKEPNFKLQIIYQYSENEDDALQKNRIRRVSNAFHAQGFTFERIKISERKEKGNIGTCEFRFFTEDPQYLVKKYNKNQALNLELEQGEFLKGQHEILNQVDWKEGIYTHEQGDRNYLIKIKKIIKENYKPLNKIRGIVIADYQKYLDDAWTAELQEKYPIKLNEKALKKMIKNKR